MLEFEQFSQAYHLPCAISELKPGDAAREAAIWHNRLFNPALPETVHVLAFEPNPQMAQLLRDLAVSWLTRAPMLLSARAGRGRADECLLLERVSLSRTHDRGVGDVTDPVLLR